MCAEMRARWFLRSGGLSTPVFLLSRCRDLQGRRHPGVRGRSARTSSTRSTTSIRSSRPPIPSLAMPPTQSTSRGSLRTPLSVKSPVSLASSLGLILPRHFPSLPWLPVCPSYPSRHPHRRARPLLLRRLRKYCANYARYQYASSIS